jgi:hypothetical protein
MYDKAEFLYPYLKEEVFPQFAPPPYRRIEIEKLSYQKHVAIYWSFFRGIRSNYGDHNEKIRRGLTRLALLTSQADHNFMYIL